MREQLLEHFKKCCEKLPAPVDYGLFGTLYWGMLSPCVMASPTVLATLGIADPVDQVMDWIRDSGVVLEPLIEPRMRDVFSFDQKPIDGEPLEDRLAMIYYFVYYAEQHRSDKVGAIRGYMRFILDAFAAEPTL